MLACHQPTYLLCDLAVRDLETWVYLKTIFCCNKSEAPFVAIGVDHGLEQVNMELKIMGGVIGLNDDSLYR